MEIRLSQKAIDEGILRIRLRRIPVEGGMLFAFAADKDDPEPVGMASLYGRGHGSSASEQTMLVFRLSLEDRQLKLSAGDLLKIKIEGQAEGDFDDIDLDVVLVE